MTAPDNATEHNRPAGKDRQDAFSYDLVPYRSWPYVQSHPDRLATIGTLMGLSPQPIERCRVLELACASGGNIIPMADTLPQSEFVGIDLSARQLEEGRSLIERLDLKNISLEHLDISDIGPRLGKFHYIIAHGVFSWVEHTVQEKILKICRDNLENNGIAFVSYNTYPGWRMRGMIRDMLLYHTAQFDNHAKQVEQARALLQFLVESVPTPKEPYAIYLKQELELLNRVRDDYLFHDHLEGTNEPVYFHQFIARAESHGLQYLGEAELSIMATSNFPDHIEETLRRISRDTIQIEQYMDFLRNRTYRQTLLCHKELAIDRSLSPRLAEQLHVASPLRRQA